MIWNGAKVAIKLPGDTQGDNGNNDGFTSIEGAVDLTPPDQSFNTVELPYISQINSITERVKGTRNGGQFTFSINARSEEDKGLLKVLEAYEDTTNSPVSFKITFTNGASALIESALVTNCSLQNGSLDSVISYAVSVECNSVLKYTDPAEEPAA